MQETHLVEWEDQISPDYQLMERLGISDHSTVYKAFDKASGEFVAIKHVPAPRSRNGARAGLREVSLLFSIKHPNLVKCLDVRYLDNSDFLIVYEFISSGDLRSLLNVEGRLSLNEWCDLAIQLFRGLESLHATGIIHCDLKPENILVAPPEDASGGRVYKIADFGVAHYFDPHASVLTKGTGSPAYMPPETFAGRASPESDLYSAGIILYEMVTGERPFRGGVRELARLHSHMVPDFSLIQWPSVRVLLSLLLQKQVAHRANDLAMLQQIVSHIRMEPMTEAIKKFDSEPVEGVRTETFNRECDWIEPDSLVLENYVRLGEFVSPVTFTDLEPTSLSGQPYLLLGDSSRLILHSPDTAASRDIFYALNERPYQIFSGDGFATSSASHMEIWNSAKFEPQHIVQLGLRISHVAFDEATMDIAWVEGRHLFLRQLSEKQTRSKQLPFPPGTTIQYLSCLSGQVVLVVGLLNPRVCLFNQWGEFQSEIRLPGPILQSSPYGVSEYLCWKNTSRDEGGPVVVSVRANSHLRMIETPVFRRNLVFIRFSPFGALLESERGELLLIGPDGETHCLGFIPEKMENLCMVFSIHETYFYIYSHSKCDNRIIIYRKKGI